MDYGNQTKQVGYATLATGSVPTPDPTASKIRDAIGGTEQAAADLHEAISALEMRLEPVLMPIPPSPAGNAGTATQKISSHVHGRITEVNSGFQHALDRLRELYRRVEV